MRKLVLIVLACGLGAQTYKPGDFQSVNPNYPKRNPFYFEGRVDWDLLKIDQPSNTWEYAQRGIHKQDDLGDVAGAIADYKMSISMNSLENGSCQIVRSAPAGFGQNVDPAPCMFTVRLRLANLLKKDQPKTAIKLLNEVLRIDPLRLGVNALIGEIYALLAPAAGDPADQARMRMQAVEAYKSELALSPVTGLSKQLTGDEANNAHVHWALADLYGKLARPNDEAAELDLYVKATKWHGDTYPWRIQVARSRLLKLQSGQ